jgi:hypothetical protein
VEADAAYLIVPTLYTFKLNGAAMAEEGDLCGQSRGDRLEDQGLDLVGCEAPRA